MLGPWNAWAHDPHGPMHSGVRAGKGHPVHPVTSDAWGQPHWLAHCLGHGEPAKDWFSCLPAAEHVGPKTAPHGAVVFKNPLAVTTPSKQVK